MGKGEVFHVPAVVSQQEAGLIQAQLALVWRRRQVLERRLLDGVEGRVVGVRQAELVVENVAYLQQFQIGIAHGADDELRDDAGAQTLATGEARQSTGRVKRSRSSSPFWAPGQPGAAARPLPGR